MKKQLQSFLLFAGLCVAGMAYGQTIKSGVDSKGEYFYRSFPPTVYDTIPSWLLTTTRRDLSVMTQRKGYAIKPIDRSMGLNYGNYKLPELKTIEYLDADKKPIIDFIVWMSIRRDE